MVGLWAMETLQLDVMMLKGITRGLIKLFTTRLNLQAEL
jgi:hypothetical protein